MKYTKTLYIRMSTDTPDIFYLSDFGEPSPSSIVVEEYPIVVNFVPPPESVLIQLQVAALEEERRRILDDWKADTAAVEEKLSKLLALSPPSSSAE